jgi:very-short-patch-repair endonuclease
MKKKTQEQFIAEAIAKHGDKYDYSKVVYTGKDKKIIIICKKHYDFEQCANSHLQGYGCKKCATEKTHLLQKSNTSIFIEKSKKIHGEMYDYSQVVYVDAKSNVIIVCNGCKTKFFQKPNGHLYGYGCRTCANKLMSEIKRKYTTSTIIEKAKEIHGDKYDYSKVEYTGVDNNIIIICNTCKTEFTQSPYCHINRNQGCKKCSVITSGINRMITKDEIIKKAKELHGDRYDYSKVEYYGIYNKIIILCRQHGQFEQSANVHIRGGGCPMCVNKTEGKLYEKLKPFHPNIINQFKQEWCKKISYLPFDFCIPEYKIIIELDGPQHFQQISNWSSPEEQFENDKYKQQCAKDNGYSVIRLLQEDVFYDTYDWLKELCEKIEEIKNCDEIVNIYLCKNKEYCNY